MISELCRRHGNLSQHVPPLEEEVRWNGDPRRPAARAVRGSESPAQADRGRPGLELGSGEGSSGKKVVTPGMRRLAVTEAREAAQISEKRACRFTGFSLSNQRYRSRRPSDEALRARLKELAGPRWGYRRLYILLKSEGCKRNRKLVQRVYRAEGLW